MKVKKEASTQGQEGKGGPQEKGGRLNTQQSNVSAKSTGSANTANRFQMFA